jgi:hypothetical protein
MFTTTVWKSNIKTIEKYFNQRNNTEKKNIVSDIVVTTSDLRSYINTM